MQQKHLSGITANTKQGSSRYSEEDLKEAYSAGESEGVSSAVSFEWGTKRKGVSFEHWFKNDFTQFLPPHEQGTGEWIDVKDRLPEFVKQYERIEVSEEVQIYDSVHGVNQAWVKRFLVDSIDELSPEKIKGYWQFETGNMTYHNVTHWQPLPSPPVKLKE